ncbi:MAG: hypothetical protein H6713_35565 [Myxococcales bacterium]|nr:hypothetical protein [Myxococcales bacterium]MCB9755289.1 hypothetical protein [Myxococcales bacterium]
MVVTTSDATTDDPTGTSTGGVCPQEFEVPQCVPAQGPPNAVACQLDVECGPQQQCFVIPLLGGLCGECTQDADCQGGGCTPPNPLQSTGAICNNGQLCAGCESDATCVDPAAALCGTVIDAAGIITVDTCGQCKTSADCSDEAPNCVPVVDSINDFTGYRACVPDCSRPQDATCEPDEHASCAPGFCTIAVLMGVIELGLCGECLSDADCEPGQSCSDPEVDINNDTMTGARCI